MTDYDEDFFARQSSQAERAAAVVVPLVLDLVAPRSVVDVGCGTGLWLAAFRAHGVDDVLGLDGAYVDRETLAVPSERFLAQDLAEPFELGRRFDLAVSLEVGEHLPEAAAAGFVASLARLAPVVLFSAAIPGQGGTSHVNEQWPAYWARLFAAHDFVHVDCLRRRLWTHPDVAPWYAQNALLYVARDELARRPELARLHDPDEPEPLALVHPTRYLEWVEWARSHVCG